MVKVITQETFDEVVRENVEEFDMDHAEAVKEAKQQFEQQGVNLCNIVMPGEDGKHKVVEALARVAGETPVKEDLSLITSLCKDDLAQRVLVTNSGGYGTLVSLVKEQTVTDIRSAGLTCLAAVMDTNPDHLESDGVNLMKALLEDPQLRGPALDWILVCCVRHEENRQALVGAGILDGLALSVREGGRAELLQVCRVWMALVQDDDIRVPFGKAHDHARDIVENHGALTTLTKALTIYKTDHDILHLCLAALASLAVRNEYCQEVVDEGGLQFLHDILLNHVVHQELVTRSLVLLKTLAGNDKVKSDISKSGGIPLILAAVRQHLARPATVEAGLQSIAAVCLRSPDTARQVMEAEGANLITSAMARHPGQRRVQAAGASAIRNIVSRDKSLCDHFINCEAEELLNAALAKHGDKVGDTLKSALRDLGSEQWTGQERWTGQKPPGLED